MNFIIDLVIVVICIAIIVISAKRGFVRSLMGLVSKLVALFVAYTFTPAFADFLKERFIMNPVVDTISTTLRSYIMTNGEVDLSKLNVSEVSGVLERYNISPALVEEKLGELQTSGEETLEGAARVVADPVVTVISTAAAFLILFTVSCLVLWLVTAIINSVFKLPVLNTANTLLGIVFGVCAAVLVVMVYSSVISSLVTSLGSISSDLFGEDVIDQTIIVKFFARHDLLGIVQKIIS